VDVWGDATRVPLFDRWYLGGLYSLRGYKYRHVGPKDYIGEPIGGGTYWFGTAEYSLPIIERLRFAMFYDVGNVYSGAYDYSHLNKYNDNWGIGLRINLPIGPLRLDYGIPITHDESSDGGGKFNFGVGYQRDF
jgi:outer membrane protein insertion porin family